MIRADWRSLIKRRAEAILTDPARLDAAQQVICDFAKLLGIPVRFAYSECDREENAAFSENWWIDVGYAGEEGGVPPKQWHAFLAKINPEVLSLPGALPERPSRAFGSYLPWSENYRIGTWAFHTFPWLGPWEDERKARREINKLTSWKR